MAMNFQGKGTPISQADVTQSLAALKVDAASLWALVTVETSGFGYLPNRQPRILYERHHFHRLTNGKFSTTHPDISNPDPGGYLGGAAEYDRLATALNLDEEAALQSASWGLGQVMGFNAQSVGFANVRAMVTAMVASEAAQLQAIVNFITRNTTLLTAFRNQDWQTVARIYNGPTYEKNNYHTKLFVLHGVYADPAKLPNLDVRTAQACLTYLAAAGNPAFNPSGVDGLIGKNTRRALNAWLTSGGNPASDLTPAILTRLMADAGV